MDKPGNSKMEDNNKPTQEPAMLEQKIYKVKTERFVAYQVVNNYISPAKTSKKEKEEENLTEEIPTAHVNTDLASAFEEETRKRYIEETICEREYMKEKIKIERNIERLERGLQDAKSQLSYHKLKNLRRRQRKVETNYRIDCEKIEQEFMTLVNEYRELGYHLQITEDMVTEENTQAGEAGIMFQNQVYYNGNGEFLSFFAKAGDGQWDEWNRKNLENFFKIGSLPNYFEAKPDETILVQLHLLDDNNTPSELFGDHSFHPRYLVNNNKPYEQFVSMLKQESTTSRTSHLRFRLTVTAGGRESLLSSVLDWPPVSISAGQKNTEDNVTVPTTEKTNSSQRSVVHIKQVVAKHANIGGASTVGERDTENNIKLKNTNVKK